MPDWIWAETNNLVTLIGYLLAGAASLLAYSQWRKEQRWKRRQALIEHIRNFDATPGARNAMMMLNSHDREIPLWDKERPEDRYERVTWDEVARALIPPRFREHSFDPKASAIRDSFEDFLERLGQLELYLEEGLLNRSDVDHVLSRWVKKLGVTDSDADPIRHLRIYLESRGMNKVRALFSRFDVDLRRNLKADTERLLAEISAGRWD